MAKNPRTHLLADSPTDPALRPKHLTKQEFGKRLYKLMISKGWHQSELARRAGVARDSVSTYVRGVSLPDPGNLEKLAVALGVDAVDLLPNHVEAAIDNDVPSLEMKISSAAVGLTIAFVFRPLGLGVVFGLALFQVVLVLATALPVWKKLRTGEPDGPLTEGVAADSYSNPASTADNMFKD
jgi:transcriptional regulator with XRE-family HTH domain